MSKRLGKWDKPRTEVNVSPQRKRDVSWKYVVVGGQRLLYRPTMRTQLESRRFTAYRDPPYGLFSRPIKPMFYRPKKDIFWLTFGGGEAPIQPTYSRPKMGLFLNLFGGGNTHQTHVF